MVTLTGSVPNVDASFNPPVSMPPKQSSCFVHSSAGIGRLRYTCRAHSWKGRGLLLVEV